MTGEDNPQGMPGAGGFHPGFGGFGGAGINIEDLMRGFGGGFGGGFGNGGRFHQGGGHPGGQRRQGGQRTYTFSFGGGGPGGMRF